MGRGRKPMVSNLNDWQSVFYNSVGSYVQIINLELARTIDSEPLSKHVRIAGGFAFKSSSYVSEGIPVIRISDFNDEKIILDNVKFYKESDHLKKYELNPGDIVIALTGGTIAKLGIVQEGIGKLYLNQRVGKFEVLNPDEFESEYVYWIARSVQSIIKDLAWGAAIPNVSPKDIERLEFPIPNRSTQKGIISFLNDLKNNSLEGKNYFNSEIEEKIISMHHKQVDDGVISSELTHQLDLVTQLRQAFLREAMQGKLVPQDENDEPASVLLEKIKAEKLNRQGVSTRAKKNKPLPPITEDEILFEIPENWVWCRLGEVTINHDGSRVPLSKYERSLMQGEFDYYGAMDVIDHINDYKFDGTYLLIAEDGQNLLRKNKPVAFLAHGKFWVNNHAHVSDCQHDITRLFVANYINTIDLEPYISGKPPSQIKLKRSALDLIPFPLPPLSEQQRIVAKLDELMGYCDELEASIKESRQQNEMLLQQVLREALEPARDLSANQADESAADRPKEKEVDG